MPNPNDAANPTPAAPEIKSDDVLAAVQAGVKMADDAPDPAAIAAPAAADPAAPADPAADPAAPSDPAADPAAEPKDGDAPAEPVKPADSEPAKSPEAEKPAEPAAKRPSDDFGDLDERVSPRTRERFDKLKSGYDELHAKYEEAAGRERQWVEGVAATGASPEQFSQSLSYLALVNKGDRASLEQARELIKTEYEFLSKHLGYAVDGHDPLDAHPDLKAKVENDGLDRDVALELAKRRAGEKIEQAASASRQSQEQVQRAAVQARADLTTLASELRAANPRTFTFKAQAIAPTIKLISEKFPPSEWVQRVKDAWALIPDPPALAAVATPSAPAAADPPTPLRPTGAGSGAPMNREPQNALEAVQFGLAALRTG